ncbi:MAG: ArsR family transcriptional regulator [Thermoproteota archaeon]|nr:ArsR family transcriptional regulator [Thermoproteota archaeon]
MDWETVSFVLSSGLRFKTLLQLSKSKNTPKKLSIFLNKPISHVSKTLKELRTKGLIECLTPSRKKARLYSITKLGSEVIEEVNKLTEREKAK